jgi:hypothetical protein
VTSSEDLLRRAFEARADQVGAGPDALDTIRARVHRRTHRRRRAAGFVALATAAAVAAVFVALGGYPPVPAPQPPGVTAAPTPTPGVRLPVYYTGVVGGKTVLYREFHTGTRPDDSLPARIEEAVRVVLADHPYDPDYTSSWPAGVSVAAVTMAGGVAVVDLVGPGTSVGQIAIQQLVWTVTAVAADRGIQLDGVRLTVNRSPLGGGVLTRAPALDTLAPVWLISPQEGDTVASHFDVHLSGAVAGASVRLRVRAADGAIVSTQKVTLSAAAPSRGESHVSMDLPPGQYTLETYPLTPTPTPDTHTLTVG